MRPKPRITEHFEEHRDGRWRREGARQVESAADAERFVEQIGFSACLTDLRNRPELGAPNTFAAALTKPVRGSRLYNAVSNLLAPQLTPERPPAPDRGADRQRV